MAAQHPPSQAAAPEAALRPQAPAVGGTAKGGAVRIAASAAAEERRLAAALTAAEAATSEFRCTT
jgi:hypothetical protein